MGLPTPIRTDIPAARLRRLARRETDGRVASRLLGLANALDGMDRGQTARLAGMDRQTAQGLGDPLPRRGDRRSA